MIDLSRKEPKKVESEPNFAIQLLVFAIFSAFLAYMILSGIAG